MITGLSEQKCLYHGDHPKNSQYTVTTKFDKYRSITLFTKSDVVILNNFRVFWANEVKTTLGFHYDSSKNSKVRRQMILGFRRLDPTPKRAPNNDPSGKTIKVWLQVEPTNTDICGKEGTGGILVTLVDA